MNHTEQPIWYHKPLSLQPDDEDLALHQQNCSSELITRRLRELVPLLDFVDCTVEEVGLEKTVLSASLLESAMNQNGTHQAAVFYLLADYTVGVGMFGVLPGVYVTGVHDRCHALPVQYWLKRGSVNHLAPGTGRLRAEVHIAPERTLQLRRQIAEKGRGEITETVIIYQEQQVVAEAHHTMGLYADVPRAPGARANLFQIQNLKTSALMIAGLREDALSQRIAEGQGRAIANRMSVATPQLPSLVRARTIHIEEYLERQGSSFPQVLVVGVGLDPKPIKFASDRQRWFGLELREMLKERERRFQTADNADLNFVPVAGDIRLNGWECSLLDAGFVTSVPTLMVLEGMSMYFSEEGIGQLLRKLARLTSSSESRIWVDHVTPSLFEMQLTEVRAFLSSMSRLGEPFVSGFENPATAAAEYWELAETASAAAVVGNPDAVHREYHFSILKPATDGPPGGRGWTGALR